MGISRVQSHPAWTVVQVQGPSGPHETLSQKAKGKKEESERLVWLFGLVFGNSSSVGPWLSWTALQTRAGFKFRDLLASASKALRLKACVVSTKPKDGL